MSEQPFDQYSEYYDLLYADKDYEAEAAYVDDLLQRHGAPRGSLLELGSGTGRHGRLLGNMGYDVTGVERSETMAARAEPTASFRCMAGDICSTELGKTFDAAVSLFHVVSYLTSNDQVAALLSRTGDHLPSGGVFAFDVWYTPAVLAQRPEVRVKRVASDKTTITRIAEPIIHPNENRVDVNYTLFVEDLGSGQISRFSESHRMRHFSLPEIDAWSQAHGFQRIGAEEFQTARPPHEDTWGVCMVLRKL